MICLVYISSAILGLSQKQILNIVKESKKNNERFDISGILLYNNGNFMQLIEGERAEVERLYEKIRHDTYSAPAWKHDMYIHPPYGYVSNNDIPLSQAR